MTHDPVRYLMEVTGLDETTARFILGLERGDLPGDAFPVDAAGDPVPEDDVDAPWPGQMAVTEPLVSLETFLIERGD